MIVNHNYIDIALRQSGWTGVAGQEYVKGDWTVIFDTSSWMVVSTRTERTVDVHVPGEYEAAWTANLIEHLCHSSDERFSLRAALETVRRATTLAEAHAAASDAADERERRSPPWLPSAPEQPSTSPQSGSKPWWRFW